LLLVPPFWIRQREDELWSEAFVSEILPSDYKKINDVCQQQQHLNKEQQ
jgi:hypothetical protein